MLSSTGSEAYATPLWTELEARTMYHSNAPDIPKWGVNSAVAPSVDAWLSYIPCSLRCTWCANC